MGVRIRGPKTQARSRRPVAVKPKNKSKFQHFLITRFNVRVHFGGGNKGATPEWLAHRWPLFYKFCVPSIREQTAKGRFTWLVLFNEKTPMAWKRKIQKLSRGVFEPIWTTGRFGSRLVRDLVKERLEPDTKYAITSRLDSDDLVAKDYMARIQSTFNNQTRMFINFKHGIVKVVVGKIREYRTLQHPRSAFLTLIEKATDKLTTVYCGDHGKVTHKKKGTIRHLKGHYGWIQILHGRNGCSAIRGRRMIQTELDLMKKVFTVW